MKRIITIVSLVCFVYTLQAQNILKCVYQEKYINNANRPDKFMYDEHVLAVSEGRSAYYSRIARYHAEKKDSLLRHGMNAIEVVGALQNVPQGREIEVYKHQPEQGKYLYYEKKSTKLYRYEDKLPEIKWNICEEMKNILGYNCQKATASLYGREWTAWFTMDIPVSDGPWLLCGLPGLILEAYDSENIFHFTTIELGNNVSLSVEPDDKKFIKCTRDELMKLRAKFEEDPLGMLQKTTGVKIQKIRDANGKEMTMEQANQRAKKQTNYYER